MKPAEIIHFRLQNQFLQIEDRITPSEVVKHMGAVQAQDYPASLWAIGLRTGNCHVEEIENAITEKKIVRSWPMRGTLNFVCAEDIRWMLKLMTPRILSRNAKRLNRDYELDESVFKICRKILTKALQGGKQLTRNDIYRVLEEERIPTGGSRGLHILWQLAQEGLICFGPRIGKQPGFVLLEEWIPDPRILSQEESLAEIALRYFNSRGPATEKDFIWWTGLTQKLARTALELAQPRLIRMETSGTIYWLPQDSLKKPKVLQKTKLLPAFDEYLIGYADRSLMLGKNSLQVVTPHANGVFLPIIIQEGIVMGTWKRTLNKNKVILDIHPSMASSKELMSEINPMAEQYALFLGLELVINQTL